MFFESSENRKLIPIFGAILMAHIAVLLFQLEVISTKEDYLAPIQLNAFTSLSSAPFRSGVTSTKTAPQKKAITPKSNTAKVSKTTVSKTEVQTENSALSTDEAVGSGGMASSYSAAGMMAKGELQQVYLSELRAKLEELKHYPLQARRLGQTGSVEVAFQVRQDGVIENARIVRGSPFKRLNESALATIENLKKFRPLPKELSNSALTVTLPIHYSIRN